jgi:hypothetical protein
MLAKNVFSSHTLQYVDPFKGNDMSAEIGKKMFDPYHDIDSSLAMDQEQIDELKGRKAKF